VDDILFFPCRHCQTRLKANKRVSGQSLACPKCGQRVMIPDSEEEVGTYGLTGNTSAASGPSTRAAVSRWCPDGQARFAEQAQAAMERARGLAKKGEWAKAISILNKLHRAPQYGPNTPESAVLSKRISYCLTRWADEELEDLEEEGNELTPPIRRLLKEARERAKYGRVFDFRTCALCEKTLKSLRGRTKITTTAGNAYLCCARPTAEDLEVVRAVDTAWKRLSLASQLDADNPEAPALRAALPSWHAALLTAEHRKAWAQRVSRDPSSNERGAFDEDDVDTLLDCLELFAIIVDIASD
jgi:hypothetical protein